MNSSFIDGGFSEAKGSRRQLINPATEEVFQMVADAEPPEIERAAAGALQAWESGWRDLAPGARAKLLFRLADLIEEHADELALLDSRSMGKPLAAARGEVIGGRADLSLLRRRDRLAAGRSAAGGAGRLRFHPAPAAGRGGVHRPLEFPLPHRLLESRARPGDRQLRAAQARRAVAAGRAPARAARDGSRSAGRCAAGAVRGRAKSAAPS